MPTASEDERRLRRAQHDAAAFSQEVKAVIRAQRHQIEVLERQAQQLANEAAAEQRFAGQLQQNDKATKLTRLQQEHSGLGSDLDAEGRKALDLASRLEAAEASKSDLRAAVSTLEQQRFAESKGKKAPLHFKLQRARSDIDEALAAAGRFREEVDHLRREKLTFLGKLRDLEVQLENERTAHGMHQSDIEDLSGQRASALSHARQMSEQNERRSHQRQLQRAHVNGRLNQVEKQARQVRSKLRQKMVSNSIAANAGADYLHKLRLKKAAWPPANDSHGLLAGVPAPTTLREHVAVLAYLINVPEDLDAICEKMAAEDREQRARTAWLDEHRRDLGSEERRNELARKELTTLDSTGGVDAGEHLSLREQLTEMQAQGVAIRNAEERHAAVLEHLSAVVTAMLAELEPDLANELKAQSLRENSGAARDELATTFESAIAAAKRRLPP